MNEGQTSVLPEKGVVKFFNKEKGFGFIEFDGTEPDLFFSYVALYAANTQDIGVGVQVVITRGVSKEGRSRVDRFLEIGGVPAEHGTFSFAAEGGFRFYSSTGTVEKGVVRTFEKDRAFGFITLDIGGSSLFFFIAELMKANRDDIEPGTRVEVVRGRAKDGRLKVSRFVKIDGVPVTPGTYSLVDGKFVLHRDDKPPSGEPPQSEVLPVALQEALAPCRTETAECKSQPVSTPSAPKPVVPTIDKDEWLLVTLRKIRQGHTSYAESDTLGQILVPWPILQKARITSARTEERFELRCKQGEDHLVAHEIRKY